MLEREHPSDTILDFDSVAKTYDGKRNAVEALNLSVQKGEFLTILGPSGSGKTTILMMLAGFEHPTEGDIRLNGKSLRRIPPFRRNIGVVFQDYALFPHRTVAENIAFPLRRRRMPRRDIQRKIAAILKLVELEGFENRRPHQLSGGQQQRVALARALVFEPSLVLMDEPLGSLDRKLREQMQYELKRIHRTTGATFLYVTHDQDEALIMSDRIAILHRGSLQQIGAPQAVYEKPENIFVARFIGENNVLEGFVHHVNGASCAVALRGGAVVTAANKGIQRKGGPAFVCVRPEHLLIGRPDKNSCNGLKGTVGELIYKGDHTLLRVDVAGQRPVIVKLKHPLSENSLHPGSPVDLHWDNRHAIAIQEIDGADGTGAG